MTTSKLDEPALAALEAAARAQAARYHPPFAKIELSAHDVLALCADLHAEREKVRVNEANAFRAGFDAGIAFTEQSGVTEPWDCAVKALADYRAALTPDAPLPASNRTVDPVEDLARRIFEDDYPKMLTWNSPEVANHPTAQKEYRKKARALLAKDAPR